MPQSSTQNSPQQLSYLHLFEEHLQQTTAPNFVSNYWALKRINIFNDSHLLWEPIAQTPVVDITDSMGLCLSSAQR